MGVGPNFCPSSRFYHIFQVRLPLPFTFDSYLVQYNFISRIFGLYASSFPTSLVLVLAGESRREAIVEYGVGFTDSLFADLDNVDRYDLRIT
jgi:hypothetical protein